LITKVQTENTAQNIKAEIGSSMTEVSTV
jgi:hypothetical protein